MTSGDNVITMAYRRADGARRFSYRMPFIFHEFLRTGDPLIARDELGFVGLAPDGAQTQYSPDRPVSATPMRSKVYDAASTQRRHQPRRW